MSLCKNTSTTTLVFQLVRHKSFVLHFFCLLPCKSLLSVTGGSARCLRCRLRPPSSCVVCVHLHKSGCFSKAAFFLGGCSWLLESVTRNKYTNISTSTISRILFELYPPRTHKLTFFCCFSAQPVKSTPLALQQCQVVPFFFFFSRFKGHVSHRCVTS